MQSELERVNAIPVRARRDGTAPVAAIAKAVTYQIGRVASYCIAGALVGVLGGVFLTASRKSPRTCYRLNCVIL